MTPRRPRPGTTRPSDLCLRAFLPGRAICRRQQGRRDESRRAGDQADRRHAATVHADRVRLRGGQEVRGRQRRRAGLQPGLFRLHLHLPAAADPDDDPRPDRCGRPVVPGKCREERSGEPDPAARSNTDQQRGCAAALEHHRADRGPARADLRGHRPGPGRVVHDAAGVEPARASQARIRPAARAVAAVPLPARRRRNRHHRAGQASAPTCEPRGSGSTSSSMWSLRPSGRACTWARSAR